MGNRGLIRTTMNTPQHFQGTLYEQQADGSLAPVKDTFLGGVTTNPQINTDHAVEVDLIAAVPTDLTGHIKSILITNREAYAVRVELYDDTTLIYDIIVPAVATVGVPSGSLVGKIFETDLTFQTQAGVAWAAGTTVDIGYYYV